MTIQEILNDLGIDFLETGHHHCRPDWVQIKQCPFCESSNYHLGWNTQLNFASCWRCGGHYGPKVLEALGASREKARSLYEGINGGPRREKWRSTKTRLKEPAGLGPLTTAHRQYLRSRGFDADTVERVWSVQGIGLAARLAWRIYIPVIHRAQKVSWTTRAIGDRVGQRYISASEEESSMNLKELVYGMDYCHHSVVITEGPLDAWKIGPGAGALFGTAFTTAQVKKLIDVPRRFICFDSETDAQRKAEELASLLSCFPGVTENWVLDSKDPGSASSKELKLIRRAAGLLI